MKFFLITLFKILGYLLWLFVCAVFSIWVVKTQSNTVICGIAFGLLLFFILFVAWVDYRGNVCDKESKNKIGVKK